MPFSSESTEAKNQSQFPHENVLPFSWDSLLWRIKTKLVKEWIAFQDRYNLFSYAHWLRDQEKRRGNPVWKDIPNKTHFGLVILENSWSLANLAELNRTITSLKQQTYPFWHAILVLPIEDQQPHFGPDERITPIFLKENETGIQQAIAKLTCEWITFCDAGDILSPTLLAEIVQTIYQTPSANVIYTDEDSIEPLPSSTLHSPWFKPDWSPEYLYSINYLRHGFYHLDINATLNSIQSIDDLTFLVTESEKSILHLPKILYHNCISQGASKNIDNAFQCALISHFIRIGKPEIGVIRNEFGNIRLSCEKKNYFVSIIIPTRDNVAILRNCLASIFEHSACQNYEIILIDTGSVQPDTLGYYEQIQTNPSIHIYSDTSPFNYSAVNNLGAQKSKGNYLLFLNNDIEVIDQNWLEDLLFWTDMPGVGVVGCRLLYPDYTIQHAGVVIGMEGHASHIFKGQPCDTAGMFGSTAWTRNVSAVTGACMMIPREIFEEIGGFDENYRLVFNDIELCLRAQQHGYRIVYTPYPRLIHHEGKSRGKYNPPADIIRASEFMKPMIQKGDPFFNPNCSLAVHFPTIRRAIEEDPVSRMDHITQYYSNRE